VNQTKTNAAGERTYRVVWVMDFEADSPRAAAERALEVQRDPESHATHFIVRDRVGKRRFEIDLLEEQEDS
jgi:hypothetical protein